MEFLHCLSNMTVSPEKFRSNFNDEEFIQILEKGTLSEDKAENDLCIQILANLFTDQGLRDETLKYFSNFSIFLNKLLEMMSEVNDPLALNSITLVH